MKITLERWEGNEFVICIEDKPQGETLSEGLGKSILSWLKSTKLETTGYFE